VLFAITEIMLESPWRSHGDKRVQTNSWYEQPLLTYRHWPWIVYIRYD